MSRYKNGNPNTDNMEFVNKIMQMNLSKAINKLKEGVEAYKHVKLGNHSW